LIEINDGVRFEQMCGLIAGLAAIDGPGRREAAGVHLMSK
jgi:hypothetical protein